MRRGKLALVMVILLVSFSVAGQDVLCTHTDGERLFKDLTIVRVSTKGTLVVVAEEWTYKIVAKGSDQFRAIRMFEGKDAPSRNPLDLFVGGEFYMLREGTSLLGYAVGTNGAARKSASESFVCKSAP